MRWTRWMRLASNVLETWREVRRDETRRDARREARREAERDGSGTRDEPMRWGEADDMDEQHGRKADERRRAADKAGKQRAERMSR